jgi:DNA-binding transcriptional LysR family regulator
LAITGGLRICTSNRLVDFTADHVDVGIPYGASKWPDLASAFILRDEFFSVCRPALLHGKQRWHSINVSKTKLVGGDDDYRGSSENCESRTRNTTAKDAVRASGLLKSKQACIAFYAL